MSNDLDLRRWSAEKLMGWTTGGHNYPSGPAYHTESNSSLSYVIRVEDWKPDDPTTGQIWMCVEQMRELGFSIFLEISQKGYGMPYWETNHVVADCQIGRGSERPKSYEASDIDPCLAMLLAMRAALEGEGK